LSKGWAGGCIEVLVSEFLYTSNLLNVTGVTSISCKDGEWWDDKKGAGAFLDNYRKQAAVNWITIPLWPRDSGSLLLTNKNCTFKIVAEQGGVDNRESLMRSFPRSSMYWPVVFLARSKK
jgi:hypothetical protein